MPLACLQGVDLHYAVTGEGPPLLLITGLGQHSGVWAGVVAELSPRYRCITFDNRGTGRSSTPAGPWTIDQMGDDAAALLAHLDVGPVAAVGWSLGGSVLQSMLIRHRDRLAKAALLSAFPSYTGAQHAWLDGLMALHGSDAAPTAKALFSMAWGMSPAGLRDHAMILSAAQAAGTDPYPTSRAALAAQGAALRVYDSRPQLPTVTTPTLVLCGEEDVLTPPAQSREMADLIPGARLRLLPRGGHRMVIEYRSEVLAAIGDFFDGPHDEDVRATR